MVTLRVINAKEKKNIINVKEGNNQVLIVIEFIDVELNGLTWLFIELQI